MSSNGPFGFDPEEFDRVVREAGEGLRDALDGVSRFFTTSGERAGWATLFEEFARQSRPRTEPETAGSDPTQLATRAGQTQPGGTTAQSCEDSSPLLVKRSISALHHPGIPVAQAFLPVST